MSPPGGLFTTTVVDNLYSSQSKEARNAMVHRAVQSGEVLRLKRGLYCLDAPFRKTQPHPFAVAAMLYSPSHISLESALSFHQLIPEAVYQTVSVTAQRSRTFSTPLGGYSFFTVQSNNPLAGVETHRLDEYFWAFVATPLRAIADLIYLRKEIDWNNDGPDFLTESMRIEPDDLAGISFAGFDEITTSIRSKRTREYLEGLRKEVTA